MSEVDWCTATHAAKLAKRIQDFWFQKRGEVVRTHVVADVPRGRLPGVHGVRSDLVDGMPRRG